MPGYYLGFWSFAFFCLLPLCLAARVEAAPSQTVSVINVLVLYTPQASAGAGGTSSILKQIDTAMVEANTVFQNSQINARVHLAHAAEINYHESGSVSNDLAWLCNAGSGVLAEAHQLRNQYNADLVCMVTETGSDWWFYGLQGPSSENAFSIIRRPYLTGGYYFPVALSFNFGCQLEPAYADSVGAFPYAYGYSFWAGDTYYSTVEGFSGQRIPYFSNPDILYQGIPMGIPAGQVNAADNVLALNQTAPMVAAFRGPSTTTLPPTVSITAPDDGATFRAGTNVVLSVNATDPDGKVILVDYYEGTNLFASSSSAPFKSIWQGIPMGEHSIFAVATDNSSATTVSAPVNIIVRPVNDDFAARSRIVGTASSVRTSTTLATAEPGESGHAGYPPMHSLWWTYTAQVDGVVTLDATRSSVEPYLAVYAGDQLSNLVEVTSTLDGYESAVRFQAASGQVFQITLDTPYGETGDVELDLHFAPLPANDSFAHRQQLSGNHVRLSADNRGATTEAGEEDQNDLQGIASMWWSWTAPADGQFVLSFSGAAGANLLPGIYTGNALTNLTQVSTDFEWPASYYVDVEKGVTYQIAVGSLTDPLDPGPFELDLDFTPEPRNDRFVNRTPVHGTLIALTNSLNLATLEPDSPADYGGSLPTLWWTWTAPLSGYVTINCQSDQFTEVFTGSTLANLIPVVSGQSVSFEATAGTTYAIAASGYGESVELNLILSTLRVVNPKNGANFIKGHDIAMMAEATANDGLLRQVQFFADDVLIGTVNRSPYTTVWRNAPAGIHALTAVGTDGNGHVRSSPPVNITVISLPPPNDNFSNRTVINGTWVSLTNSDVAGTSEPGEPDMLGAGWGNSIWWSWTAPVAGWVTISTPTPFTAIGVYTGSTVSNLTQATANYGTVAFEASPGTTYNIAAVGVGNDVVLQLSLSNLRIVSPTNGATFATGSNIPMLVDLADTEQPIRQVEYFHNGFSLGIVTNPPYSLTWTNVPRGTNSLMAVATDAAGHPRSSPPVTVQIRPPNDNFTNATILVGENVGAVGSTADATVEPGEPRPVGLSGEGSTVWYSWTAPTTGYYSIAVNAVVYWEYMLEIYTGTELANLTHVPRSGTFGAANFMASAGVTYYMAIDSVNDFTLDLGPVPANDDFANAFVLTGTNVFTTEDNTMATAEPGEPDVTYWVPDTHSVWYTWTAPTRGFVTVGAISTNFTPVVHVFTGTSIAALTPLGTNSTAGISFIATAGTSYQIAVDGSGGFFTLNLSLISPPGNDAFESRFLLSGLNPAVQGTTFLASFQPGEPGFYPWIVDRSVWYSWIAPADGTVRLHCTNKPIAVYTGNSVSNLTVVAPPNPTNFVDLVFTATTGTEYEIAVAGANWLPDDFTLSLVMPKAQIACPTYGTAFPLAAGFEIVARTIDIDGAVVSVGFFDGTNLLATATNAPFQMVYSNVPAGSHLLSLQSVDQNGLVSTSEPIEVRVKPQNDNFAQRFVISNALTSFVADNSGATSEPGETLPGGATGRTLWWTWTAPSNAVVTITTTPFFMEGTDAIPTPNPAILPNPAGANSPAQSQSVIITGPNFGPPGPTTGPLFSVYTGTTLSNLSLFASNSVSFTSLALFSPPEWCVLPSVSFPVVDGQTYQFSFDGVNGSFGSATINFSVAPPPVIPAPPVNDNFAQATPLSAGSLTVTGTTVKATCEPGELIYGVDPSARTVWYSWTAPASGDVQVVVDTGGPDYLDLGIYAGSSLWHLTSVASSYGVVSFYALAGTTYKIEVDGPNGLGIDFSLSLNGPPSPPSIDLTHTVRLANGSCQIRVTGVTGQSFVLQASSDSQHWVTIRTDTLLGSYMDIIDTTAAKFPQRVYRVLPLDAVLNYQPFALSAPGFQPDAGFGLHLTGMAGQPFRLQVSTNLLDWSDLTGGVIVNDTFDFNDSAAPNFNRRFYRAFKQ